MKRITGFAVVLLALSTFSPLLRAQGPTFDEWFDQRVRDLKLTDVNSKVPEKQKDSPSAAASSTSLVDESAATDFVSLAMGLVPIGSPDTSLGDGNMPSVTSVTVSAYSLAAWGRGKELTDPEFYKIHTNLRKLYFTLGTAESKIVDDNTDRPATVLGVKYLIFNQRDIYSSRNQKYLTATQEAVTRAGAVEARLKARIQETIRLSTGSGQDEATFLAQFSDANFPKLLQSLKPATLQQIDDLIVAELPAFLDLQTAVSAAYDAMHGGQQLAVSATTSLRPAFGNDDYRVQLIYDHGLSSNITWTVNASGDYQNRRLGDDFRGGRIATEFLGTLNRSDEKMWSPSSFTLSFSAEALWQTKVKPTYTFQARLSIPLITGIELPIVYRYANRTVITNTADPEARLGLSVDIGRLTQLFK